MKHVKGSNEIEIEKLLYIIPDAIREQTMMLAHSTLLTMHPGAEESIRQCQLYFYWPKMREDFELFVAACVTCGRCKQPAAYLKAPLKHVVVHEFNDAISIDHIVPERDIATPRSHRYILTITDVFTGYLVAVPARSRKSEETIRLILHNWALDKGFPKEILADNDPGFSSEFYNAVLKAFNIKLTHGTPYKCSSTSKAERSNKRINNALRLCLDDKQLRDWDLYLPYVCFALNCLRSRHTGYSPNKLVYGKELNTPQSILIENEPVDLDCRRPHSAKAYQLHMTIKNIVRRARRNATADFKYADNWYNQNLHGPYFKTDDWCFVLVNCPKHKFSQRWRGPYKISKVVNNHLYVVEMDNGVDKLCNISKLKHYKKSKYSPNTLNPHTPPFLPTANNTHGTSPEPDNELSDGPHIDLEVETHDIGARKDNRQPTTAPEVPTIVLPATEELPPSVQYDNPDLETVNTTGNNLIPAPVNPVQRRRSPREHKPITDRYQAGF